MGTGATGNLATAVAPTAGAVSPFAGGDPIMGTGGSGELATPAGAGVNPLAGGDPIMGTGASGELATPGSPAAGGVAVPAVGTSTGGGELAGGGLAEAGNAAANLSAFSSPSVDFSALDVNPSGAAGFDAGGGGSFSGAGSVPSGGSGMPGYFEGDSSGALGDVSSINDPDAIAKAAAAAGGGSSTPTTAGTGVLQSILDGAKKNPLAVGAFAANLLAQLKANKSGTGTADQLKALGQPTQDIATDLLAQYKSDTLNPSSQQAIDAWKQQQTASIKNYYAKAGIPDSTAAKHAIADIEAKAVAMADLARQGLLDEGLKVAGVAQGPLTAAIAQQARQDTALSTASSSALNSLMTLLTLQNKTPTATPAA